MYVKQWNVARTRKIRAFSLQCSSPVEPSPYAFILQYFSDLDKYFFTKLQQIKSADLLVLIKCLQIA